MELTNSDIKKMIKAQIEISSEVYYRDRAKLKLIELVCYCDNHGLSLNELIEEFNELKKQYSNVINI